MPLLYLIMTYDFFPRKLSFITYPEITNSIQVLLKKVRVQNFDVTTLIYQLLYDLTTICPFAIQKKYKIRFVHLVSNHLNCPFAAFLWSHFTQHPKRIIMQQTWQILLVSLSSALHADYGLFFQ